MIGTRNVLDDLAEWYSLPTELPSTRQVRAQASCGRLSLRHPDPRRCGRPPKAASPQSWSSSWLGTIGRASASPCSAERRPAGRHRHLPHRSAEGGRKSLLARLIGRTAACESRDGGRSGAGALLIGERRGGPADGLAPAPPDLPRPLTVRGRRSFLAGISPGSGTAMMLEHLRRMARYNAWANRRLYEACAQLPEVQYRRPRTAFFGSIHGTLNHLLVADWIWLAHRG